MVNRTGRQGCPDATGSWASAVLGAGAGWLGREGGLPGVGDRAVEGDPAAEGAGAEGAGAEGAEAGGAAESVVVVRGDGVDSSVVVDDATFGVRPALIGDGAAMGCRTATVTPTPTSAAIPATATAVAHRGRR
jgi:hypothetical protein